MKKSRNEEALAITLTQEDRDDFETKNLLPPYRTPRRSDVPPVTIPSDGHVTLVAAKKPKDMEVLQNIMPQLAKFTFQDSDTNLIR